MDPVTLGILLASGGLVVLGLRGAGGDPKPEALDWEAFLRSELAIGASDEQRVAFDRMQELGMEIPVKLIASREDLFELYAVESDEHLSRCFYEITVCGAWCKIFPPGRVRDYSRDRFEIFRASLEVIGNAVRCTSLTDAEGVSCLEDPHEDVAFFLHVQPGGETDLDASDIEGIRESKQVHVMRRRAGGVDVEIRVLLMGWRDHSGGLEMGSVVEGSDAETSRYCLYFPFSEDRLDAEILELEDEASRLYDEAHPEEEWDQDW